MAVGSAIVPVHVIGDDEDDVWTLFRNESTDGKQKSGEERIP